MGSIRGRFADLSGIHQQTHGAVAYDGGYDDNVDAQTPPLAGWTGQANSSAPINDWTVARAILSPPRGRAEYSNGQWTGGEEGHYQTPLESAIKRMRGGSRRLRSCCFPAAMGGWGLSRTGRSVVQECTSPTRPSSPEK
jgi:hypothetical protein